MQSASSASPPPSWKRLGATIVGDAAFDKLGNSVSLSADASTLAIGAPEHNDDMGYVKVYRIDNDGGDGVQLGQTIYGDAADNYFGDSVDITPDGTTIICGSSGFSGRPGYVRVFSLEGDIDLVTDNWKQIGQEIVGEANGDYFGRSVSISEDGKTIAVGAPNSDGNNGAHLGRVRIYCLADDGTSWEKIGQDIDGMAAGDSLGRSVSLSADGSIVAIGAPGNSNNGDYSGHVAVYRIDDEGSSWERLGQNIHGDNEDYFGYSVNLSPDGSTLAIGSPKYYGDGAGYVRVFSLSSGDDTDTFPWKQIGQDIVGFADNDRFGYSVSLSDDGRTLAVGARRGKGKNGIDSGIVRIYRMNDAEMNWIQIGDDIDGEAVFDLSGHSVSLSANGNKAAIGSPNNGDNGDYSGHVRVFRLK